MSNYRIPVSWTVDSLADVEADCLDDAVEQAKHQALPKESAFRTGSFEVHEEEAQILVPACYRSVEVEDESNS